MPDRGDFSDRTEITVPVRIVFPHGLDASKSATPVAGETYLATDTKILYVCFADGVWEALCSL